MNRLIIKPTEARDSITLNRCFSIMDEYCLALTNGSMTLLISLLLVTCGSTSRVVLVAFGYLRIPDT